MNCNELQQGAKGNRYIIKRPKALQCFCDGHLHKDSDEERQARIIMAGFMLGGLVLTVPLFLSRVSIGAKAGVVVAMIVYQEQLTWSITLSPWLKRRLGLRYSTAVDMAYEIDLATLAR